MIITKDIKDNDIPEITKETYNFLKKQFGYNARIGDIVNLIEKSFGNLKERLDMRRMSVASEENFEGKLFVQFVALSMLSYIKKQMDEHGLFKNYTMQSLLDELDIIEYYQQPGKAHHLSEITNKQRELYELLGVKVPT